MSLRSRLTSTIVLGGVLLVALPAQAQDTAIGWSSFSMGFTVARAANTQVISTLGQSFAGSSQQGNTQIESGFLAQQAFDSRPHIDFAELPPATVEQGNSTSVRIKVSDNNGVAEVYLLYRKGGSIHFDILPMSLVGDSFEGTIPEEFAGPRGLEYRIMAVDVQGNTRYFPASGFMSIQVEVTGHGARRTEPQPAGSAQTAYRLISMPMDLGNKSPEAVLVDNLGPYDRKNWRLYEWRNGWFEYPDVSGFAPGKAFFLIVKHGGKFLDSGPGTSIATSTPFAIALNPGWNLVGNPFNFAIPLANIRLKSTGLPPMLRTFDGTWSEAGQVLGMYPFGGYAMFNNSTAVDSLLVYPVSGADLGASMPKAPVQLQDDTRWAIRILAKCQQARDGDNVAAVADDAASGWDQRDHPEPPFIGEYVSVYFPHDDWETLAHWYSSDVRAARTDGYEWDFEVKTNIADAVRLGFQGVADVPAGLQVWLVDEDLGVARDLRRSPEYAFVAPREERAKSLKLVVGKPEFIEGRFGELTIVPRTHELSQNFPNPFSSSGRASLTTIRFGLPDDDRVSLRIYNLLGELVAELVDDRPMHAGYHALVWDGRSQSGLPAASGMYVYRLRTRTTTLAKRMVLVR